MAKHSLPFRAQPCKDCPFNKNTLQGWLGEVSAKELTECDSFLCHKNTKLQCAGHMLLLSAENIFFRLLKAMRLQGPKGRKTIFETKEKFIEHHANS